MKLKSIAPLVCLIAPALFTGCGPFPYAGVPWGYTAFLGNQQTELGGQTLPSAYYLRDDVQYFPAGPEEQLPNLKRALRQYQLEQSGGLSDVQ